MAPWPTCCAIGSTSARSTTAIKAIPANISRSSTQPFSMKSRPSSTRIFALNVLLSFAQFEREVTGERIRDKIAASKKRGLWMGGLPSLGYDIKDRKLIVNEQEAETVRHIFRRYLEV